MMVGCVVTGAVTVIVVVTGGLAPLRKLITTPGFDSSPLLTGASGIPAGTVTNRRRVGSSAALDRLAQMPSNVTELLFAVGSKPPPTSTNVSPTGKIVLAAPSSVSTRVILC